MRVLEFITILGTLFLVGGLFGGAEVEGQWIENAGTCSGSLYSPSSMRHMIKTDDVSGVINSLSGKNLCFNRSDYQISELRDDSVRYCGPGTVVAKKSPSNEYLRLYCCTEEHPYWDAGANYCCPGELMSTTPQTTGMCDATPFNINKFQLKQATLSKLDNLNDLFEPIQPGTTSYVCPATSCLTNRPPVMRGTLLNHNFTIATPLNILGNYECLPMGTDLSSYSYEDGTFIEPGEICVAQKAQDPVVATLVHQAPGVLSCTELVGSEQQRCLECLEKNFEAAGNDDPQTYVYSSIGCIDTRRDPFVTRLFQLGFGMLSGFAVVRLMWAAVKMQSADPAKIQEGRDMATSAIIAIVTLAAAIPILRYLGINLLSILPFNFLR